MNSKIQLKMIDSNRVNGLGCTGAQLNRMWNFDQRILNFIQRMQASMWKLLLNRHLANICMWLCCLKHAVHVDPTLNRMPSILSRKKNSSQFASMQIDCSSSVCFALRLMKKKCKIVFNTHTKSIMKKLFGFVQHEFSWKFPAQKKNDRPSKSIDKFEFQRESWYQKQTSLLSSF